MKLTCIVSAYNRPECLRLMLQCLRLQTVPVNIIVTDNSPTEANREVTELYGVEYVPTKLRECYESAEAVMDLVATDFVCFPSDDNYYVREFAERMLKAAEANGWALVYSDMLYDPRWAGRHTVVECQPQVGMVDKGGFIVRKDLFQAIGGFPGKNGAASASDGLFVVAASQRAPHGRVPEVLWFHG